MKGTLKFLKDACRRLKRLYNLPSEILFLHSKIVSANGEIQESLTGKESRILSIKEKIKSFSFIKM